MNTLRKPLNEWAVEEPVEFRLFNRQGEMEYVALFYVTDRGTIGHSLQRPSTSIPHALSNLQSRGTMPMKAVQGWQYEAFNFVQAGLYGVGEVR